MEKILHLLRNIVDAVFPPHERHRRTLESLETIYDIVSPKEAHGVTYLLPYTHPLVKDAIVSLKSSGDSRIVAVFGNILHDYLSETISEDVALSNLPIIITCIPISKNKKAERGFNQCERILQKLSEKIFVEKVSCDAHVLRVQRDTGDQVGKSKHERFENLKHAFEADQNSVGGTIVYVFDDVLTTGATLGEAVRALRAAKARKVIPIALSH